LFVQDAKAGTIGNLRCYREIVQVLIAGGANFGSGIKGARIVRAEHDRLRRAHKLHVVNDKRELADPMDLAIKVAGRVKEPSRKPPNAVKLS
jgi:hypothetical protein